MEKGFGQMHTRVNKLKNLKLTKGKNRNHYQKVHLIFL